MSKINGVVQHQLYVIELTSKRGMSEDYPNCKVVKIGEYIGNKRPFDLVAKYTTNVSTAMPLMTGIDLIIDNERRITDHNIRKYINSKYSDIKEISDYRIGMYTGIALDNKANDGYTEFIAVPNSYNINDIINDAIEYFNKHKNEATGKVRKNYTLEYDVKHLVNLRLCDRIHKFMLKESGLGIDLYKTADQEILFIGQFDNIFLNRIADENNITLFIDDTKSYESTLTLDGFNVKLVYSMEELEEIMAEKDFDIVISNPPYGKIGAEITHAIIDNVNYKEFVNLLPANDYHRGSDDLYKYADVNKMISIRGGFADAAVTTYLAKINKKASTITEDEFEIENYIDDSLKKYFYENRRRDHYAIDIAQARPKWNDNMRNLINVNNSFIIHMRDANHGYIPNSGAATSVKWNLNRELDIDYLHENYWQNDTQSVYGFITFNTQTERDNFTNFMLGIGWAFMCKVMKAMNVDSSAPFRKYLPKVDWTRSWTVEEILADYGYTEVEIKEVMDDLVNFKGMDD